MVIRLLTLSIAVLVSGCAPKGIIYSDTVVPYTKNFSLTPVGSKKCEVQKYQLKEPVTGYNITAEWTTDYILNKAHDAGIKEINYIDKRTISVLMDVYKRETLIVYGN
jgi:hypothetical protein